MDEIDKASNTKESNTQKTITKEVSSKGINTKTIKTKETNTKENSTKQNNFKVILFNSLNIKSNNTKERSLKKKSTRNFNQTNNKIRINLRNTMKMSNSKSRKANSKFNNILRKDLQFIFKIQLTNRNDKCKSFKTKNSSLINEWQNLKRKTFFCKKNTKIIPV